MPTGIISISSIVAAAIGILFLCHYFLYYSLTHFFKISNGNKIALIIIFAILSLSYVFSSIAAHVKENSFTKTFYFIGGLWLGIAATMIFIFLLAWLTVGISKLFGADANYAFIGSLAGLFAILYSIYGVWNAYNPRIKNISVKINNLPQEWKGKVAVQLSDVHLGHVLGPKFLQQVVNKVNSMKPDIVFITGDLFDGMDGQTKSRVKPIDNIEAPLGVFFVTGNHENYFGLDKVYELLSKTKVKVLKDEMVKINGMQIIGLGYPEKLDKNKVYRVLKHLTDFDPRKPSILLWHSPSQVESAKGAGISLMLSGHTHRGQIFPINYITMAIYRRYYHGFFKEENFNIYTSSGVGTWGPTMRTGNRPEIVVITFE